MASCLQRFQSHLSELHSHLSNVNSFEEYLIFADLLMGCVEIFGEGFESEGELLSLEHREATIDPYIDTLSQLGIRVTEAANLGFADHSTVESDLFDFARNLGLATPLLNSYSSVVSLMDPLWRRALVIEMLHGLQLHLWTQLAQLRVSPSLGPEISRAAVSYFAVNRPRLLSLLPKRLLEWGRLVEKPAFGWTGSDGSPLDPKSHLVVDLFHASSSTDVTIARSLAPFFLDSVAQDLTEAVRALEAEAHFYRNSHSYPLPLSHYREFDDSLSFSFSSIVNYLSGRRLQLRRQRVSVDEIQIVVAPPESEGDRFVFVAFPPYYDHFSSLPSASRFLEYRESVLDYLQLHPGEWLAGGRSGALLSASGELRALEKRIRQDEELRFFLQRVRDLVPGTINEAAQRAVVVFGFLETLSSQGIQLSPSAPTALIVFLFGLLSPQSSSRKGSTPRNI